MLMLLWGSSAVAGTLRICATIDVDFVDLDGLELAPVRWHDPSVNRPARFADYSLWKDVGGTYVLIDPGVLDQAGCTPTFTLDPATGYKLKLISTGYVDDSHGQGFTNYLRVEDVIDGDYAVSESYFTTPNGPFSGTQTVAPLPGTTDLRWSHFALASTALWLNPAGLDGRNFYVYSEEPCGAGSTSEACVDEQEESVFLGSSDSRYEVAKRLGQLVAAFVDEGGYGCDEAHEPFLEFCVGDSTFATPGLIVKAYQTEAACEAIGRYYAAITWNPLVPSGGSSCRYRWNSQLNWDLDEVAVDWEQYEPFSCYGDPWLAPFGSADPDGENWLDDMDEESSTSCGDTVSTTFNTTSLDFLRYFWALVADEGVTRPEVWELWDLADSHNWSTVPADQAPEERLEEAAIDVGVFTAHDAAKSHFDQ